MTTFEKINDDVLLISIKIIKIYINYNNTNIENFKIIICVIYLFLKFKSYKFSIYLKKKFLLINNILNIISNFQNYLQKISFSIKICFILHLFINTQGIIY